MDLERFLDEIERDEAEGAAEAVRRPTRFPAVALLFTVYGIAWGVFFCGYLLRLDPAIALRGAFLIPLTMPVSLVVALIVARSAASRDFRKGVLLAAGLWFLAIPVTLLVLFVAAAAVIGDDIEAWPVVVMGPMIATFVVLASVVLGTVTGVVLALPWPFWER